MGKFEKLVVLTVLFAAVVVLALSFDRDGDEVNASDPLSGAQEVLEQDEGAEPSDEVRIPTAEETGAADEAPAGSLLLHAGAETQPLSSSSPAALTTQTDDAGGQRILTATQGLRPSFLDDYMMYTVVEGDTWSALAQRFYQDGRYTRNLHLANEDLVELTPGKELLVPVFDFLAVEPGLQPGGEAADAAASSASLAEAAPAFVERPSSPASGAKALEYEVRAGDTLSDISLAMFGTATRWNEILDANRDRLAKPEALQVGMKLRIPEGGKLPSQRSAPEKSEAKPKTAQASEKAPAGTTAKKKKVL